MLERLKGWSIRVFAGKLMARSIAPMTAALVGLFTDIAPDTVSQQGAEAVQGAAALLTYVLVEALRNVLRYATDKKAETEVKKDA